MNGFTWLQNPKCASSARLPALADPAHQWRTFFQSSSVTLPWSCCDLTPPPPPKNRWGRRSSCCCAENVVCYPVSLWGSCIEILCPRLSAPLNSRNTGTQCLEANSGVVIVRCKWCVVNHIQVEGLVCVCVCQRGLQSDWHHLPVNAVAL